MEVFIILFLLIIIGVSCVVYHACKSHHKQLNFLGKCDEFFTCYRMCDMFKKEKKQKLISVNICDVCYFQTNISDPVLISSEVQNPINIPPQRNFLELDMSAPPKYTLALMNSLTHSRSRLSSFQTLNTIEEEGIILPPTYHEAIEKSKPDLSSCS
jgi:hypothetical protein